MPYHVYILQSQVDESFYIGYTSNLANRVREHNVGSTRYTMRKRPWKLVYTEEFNCKSDAIKRERFLKKQRNQNFYNRLIGGWKC